MKDLFLLDTLWTMVAAVLVIFMLGGFILLEAGSTRMKNAGHITTKTVFTCGIAALVFWTVGFAFIFGGNSTFLPGHSYFFYNGGPIAGINVAGEAFFLFQLAFALISLTIAFGGFAERAKLPVYVIFSVLFTAFIYPIITHWIWGGGWLSVHGKQDFAGSTVVHLTGAMAALAATVLLKPRIGKFNKDGSANKLTGHNQVFTVLGIVVLWVGWFGFNSGSTISTADGFFAYVALNTHLAASAAAVSALFISWITIGKADMTTILNGALGGLVAITASCAFVEPWAAVVIGGIAGLIVYYSMMLLEKLKIDDPIYALSVHGTPGVWGTLANGLFAAPELAFIGSPGLFYGGGWSQLGVQALGVIASGLYAFCASLFFLFLLKKMLNGLRVTKEEELRGLDLSEHGSYGYPEFFIRFENERKSS